MLNHTSLQYFDHEVASNDNHTINVDAYGPSLGTGYSLFRINIESSNGDFIKAVHTSGTTETDRFIVSNDGTVTSLASRIRANSSSTLAFAIEESGQHTFRIYGDGHVFVPEIKVMIPADFPNSYPDYVFEKEYDLMPLNELRKFINQNGHLPEIPSEKYVVDNGMALGEMNINLLKKVEELTLYILELEQRLSKIESK